WVAVVGGFARRLPRVYNAAKSQILDPDPNKIVQVFDVVGLDDMGEIVPIPNGVRLGDVLQNFAPCGLTVQSNFFGQNPTGPSPVNTPYTEALANLQNVLIFQKSDVKRPTASNIASRAPFTYQKLLGVLRALLNVVHRPSAAGVLRIEHVSYFAQASGLDLTLEPYRSMIARRTDTTSDDADAARSERWRFMEEVSPMFQGQAIRYDESCVLGDATEETTITIESTNTDVLFIQGNPDAVANEGYVIVASFLNAGKYYLVSETSLSDGNLYPNAHLSIPNALDVYHRHERLYPSGSLNGSAVTFASSRKRRTGEPVEFVLSNATYWSTFDASKTVATPLGGLGEVRKARYSAANCSLQLEISY
ncbi:MAG: hypothetical protein ACRCT6_03040, partial [Notoacmeibacter sp.]